MSWFPFFMELKGKKGLIVGGGKVAVRKAEKMLPFGTVLTMIAPAFCEEAIQLENIERVCRRFLPKDIEGMCFVIGATDELYTNQEIYELCKKRHIPVNIVDDKEKCTFLFPALVKQGEFVAGFTTGGSSPLAAAYIRKWVEENLPENLEDIIAFMGMCRQEIRKRYSAAEDRAYLLREIFCLAMQKGRGLSSVELEEILKRRNDHGT